MLGIGTLMVMFRKMFRIVIKTMARPIAFMYSMNMFEILIFFHALDSKDDPQKITRNTHGIPNLRPMDKYIKLVIFQLIFVIMPRVVYVALYNWQNIFLIVAKNKNVVAQITKLSSINWCKQHWMKYLQFSFTFSDKFISHIMQSQK